MDFLEREFSGVFEIKCPRHQDIRGGFTKVFHSEFYAEAGISDVSFKEEYYSVSNKNVLRGMHFQIPPHHHAKLVYCILGEVQDVLIDLRCSSKTFGQSMQLALSETNGNVLYIPKGIAHGFLALSDTAVMVYKTTSVYSPEHDKGLSWQSFKEIWKSDNPILSDRDLCHPLISEFQSPF